MLFRSVGVSAYGCKVDVSNQKLIKATTQTDASTTLNYNSNSGLYSYDTSSSTSSKYTRLITMTQGVTSDEILVASTMYWTGSYLSGGTKSFTIRETLYKWQTK